MKHLFIVLITVTNFFYANQIFQSRTLKLNKENNYSELQIKAFVNEVYGEAASKLVFQNDQRFNMIKRFFNTIEISCNPDINANKAFPNTLDFPLINKYKQNLKYDETVVDPNKFNPLKYDIDMFPNKKTIYRIGNSKYLLAITPQN